MPFELTLDGRKYNTDDLSLADAVELETMLGKTWRELNPLGSAAEFQGFAELCLRRDHPKDQAAKIATEMSLGDALAAARWVGDDLPVTYEDGFPDPKAEGGSSTTTSSTSPDPPTGGPRTSRGGKASGT
jgi:hypothetical protein